MAASVCLKGGIFDLLILFIPLCWPTASIVSRDKNHFFYQRLSLMSCNFKMFQPIKVARVVNIKLGPKDLFFS